MIPGFADVIAPIAKNLFKAAVLGGRRIKILSLLAAFLVTSAITLVVLSENITTYRSALTTAAGILGAIGGILILAIAGYQNAITAAEKGVLSVVRREIDT